MLRLRAVLFAVIFAGSIVLLSLYGPGLGISRTVGTYAWAALMVLLSVAIFGPPMAGVLGWRQTAFVFAAIVGMGVGLFLYLVFVSLPALNARP